MSQSDSMSGGTDGGKPRKGATKFAQLAVPTSVGRHTYVVIYSPEDCEDYLLSQQVEIFVAEPPPEYVVIDNAGECRGAVLMLDE